MSLLGKLLYDQNWNIAFPDITSEELLESKKLKGVNIFKHGYLDRWFADPFIYKVKDDVIVVFAEERGFEEEKGRLVELVIDRNTYKLRERYVLLEVDTHLSYPAFINQNGKTYAYPENGLSGTLQMYEYNEQNHSLVSPKLILDEAVADATIMRKADTYLMVATRYPNTETEAYLYSSKNLSGPYSLVESHPFEKNANMARPGGNFFQFKGSFYRPAQDCSQVYGGGLAIKRVFIKENSYAEEYLFKIDYKTFKYNLGIHTLNFSDGICVIDLHGYAYPIIARIIIFLWRLKKRILK